MKVHSALGEAITQAEFALCVALSEARVSQLMGDGVLPRGGTGLEWLHAYVERLREQAAGRMGAEVGGLDLAQERAALAREMRHGHEIKNAVARGEYGAIVLLAEVLATASQAVVERLDQLPAMLKKSCPDLPDAAREQIITVLANARNEWVRSTAQLITQAVVSTEDGVGGELADLELGDPQ